MSVNKKLFCKYDEDNTAPIYEIISCGKSERGRFIPKLTIALTTFKDSEIYILSSDSGEDILMLLSSKHKSIPISKEMIHFSDKEYIKADTIISSSYHDLNCFHKSGNISIKFVLSKLNKINGILNETNSYDSYDETNVERVNGILGSLKKAIQRIKKGNTK